MCLAMRSRRQRFRLRLSLQSEPTERGIERCRINPCVGGGLRTGSRLDYFRPDESQRRRLQSDPGRGRARHPADDSGIRQLRRWH
jgi:hypothetical protein